MKRIISTICVSVALLSAAHVAQAQDANLEKAMGAVFKGPQVKKLKIRGHEFNVKKATFTRNGDTVTVKGQLSHCLSLRPDDQLFYTIVKKGDRVLSVDMRIEKGGALKVVSFGAKAIGFITGRDIPSELYESLLKRVDNALSKGWEDAAAFIVANVGMRTDAGGADAVLLFRAKSKAGNAPRTPRGKPYRPKSSGGGVNLQNF